MNTQKTYHKRGDGTADSTEIAGRTTTYSYGTHERPQTSDSNMRDFVLSLVGEHQNIMELTIVSDPARLPLQTYRHMRSRASLALMKQEDEVSKPHPNNSHHHRRRRNNNRPYRRGFNTVPNRWDGSDHAGSRGSSAKATASSRSPAYPPRRSAQMQEEQQQQQLRTAAVHRPAVAMLPLRAAEQPRTEQPPRRPSRQASIRRNQRGLLTQQRSWASSA